MHISSSNTVYKNRIIVVLEYIENCGLEAILISNEKNIRYLTGFWGKDSQSYLLLTHEYKILFTDFRFIKQAEQQNIAKVHQWREPKIQYFAEKMLEIGIEELAVEDSISYFEYKFISGEIPGVRITPVHRIVEYFRKTKNSLELEKIKKAANIVNSVFKSVVRIIKPGIKEIDVAAEIEYQMRKTGADDRAFDVIVASGENSSMPHATATGKKIKIHDSVIVDYGAIVDGYCSDITRTIFMGDVPKAISKLYKIVREAQELALGSIKKDMSCKELDLIARNYIDKYGYGDKFGHGLGHGIGLDIHEEPFINSSSKQNLELGMVFTVEPGIYIPDWGGIRIEDMVVIEDGGVDILTKADKELIII